MVFEAVDTQPLVGNYKYGCEALVEPIRVLMY